VAVWGLWLDGAFYFSTAARSQKARNLSANPACVVTTESADEAVIVEGVAEFERTAREVTGMTAAAGVTGTYIQEAEAQRGQADFWRWVALALLVLVTSSAVTTASIASPFGGDVSTEELVEYGATRIPVVLLLTGVFGYAAKQSSEHRTRERTAHRMAMELTAFRPYLRRSLRISVTV